MPREKYTYELSVVIVSYNTKDLLRECLQSVYREADGMSIEVLLVDNNSSDGSPLMVEMEFPQVRLIRSAVNLGFGAANNLALEVTQGRFIVLLNSDAFLSHGSLRIARDHMHSAPEVALGGARLVGRDLSWQPSARMFPHVVYDALMLTGLAAKFPGSRIFGRFDRTWADPLQPCPADWVPGAFSIIRAEALAKVGFFDPRFFMYAEEVDLCRRIKLAGYKIWYWARYRDHTYWRGILAHHEGWRTLWRAGNQLAHAQYSALLPQTPREYGKAIQMAGIPVLSRELRA